MQPIIHYFLHLIAPFFIAYFFYRHSWIKVYLIFLATMLVDLDHLLTTPIFDPNRCSINFHPFHSYYAIGFYMVLVLLKNPYRIFGLGLLFHMATDALDCWLSSWFHEKYHLFEKVIFWNLYSVILFHEHSYPNHRYFNCSTLSHWFWMVGV